MACTWLPITVSLIGRLFFQVLIFSGLSSCTKQPLPKPVVTYPGYHKKNLGASARDFLSSEVFTSLTVEVQYMNDFRPEPETMDSLLVFLRTYLRKPGGIKIVLKRLNVVSPNSLAKDEVAAIEDSARTLFPSDKNLAVYLLFTDAGHGDKNILGMAYRNTSAVIFGHSIATNSGINSLLTKAELETSVVLHEIGHLLGLGNPNGIALSSKAGKGKHGHCHNKTCLMYWATETRNLSVITRRGKIPQLDKECVEVLEKLRGDAILKAPASPAWFVSDLDTFGRNQVPGIAE
jgi:hypothetical protein